MQHLYSSLRRLGSGFETNTPSPPPGAYTADTNLDKNWVYLVKDSRGKCVNALVPGRKTHSENWYTANLLKGEYNVRIHNMNVCSQVNWICYPVWWRALSKVTATTTMTTNSTAMMTKMGMPERLHAHFLYRRYLGSSLALFACQAWGGVKRGTEITDITQEWGAPPSD